MFLVDTNVVSELRKPRPHGAVVAWVESLADEQLFLSAVTLAELQAGVELTRDQDPRKAAEIESWIDALAKSWNVLVLDARIFRLWARLAHRRSDHLSEDAMIAATAIVHRLTVATRNVADFRTFEVPVFDPFSFRS